VPLRSLAVASAVAAAALLAACRATTDFRLFRPARTVVVSPADTVIAEGRTFRLRAAALDDQGDTVTEVVPTFRSADTTVLRVTAGGMVTGVGAGGGVIVAEAGGLVGSAYVLVTDSTILAHLLIPVQPFDIGIGPRTAYVTTLTGVVPLDLGTLTVGPPAAGNFYVAVEVAFDAAGDLAYVSNETATHVEVVSTATNAQVDTIGTNGGSIPLGVMGGALFVGTTSNFLFRFDLATRRATDSIALRGTAYHLLVDPADTTVFVTAWDLYDATTGDVLVVNGSTLAVIRSVHVGGHPQAMALAPDRQTLYVADETVPYLLGIAVATGTVAETIPLDSPAFGLAISSDGARLYAGLASGGRVEVIDRATRARVRVVTVGGIPREVRYDAAHRHVLVANEAGWVDVIAP
jgi:YVTN family beta-propeller protein